MNISGLKPARDYSEHDVLALFAGTGNMQKGTLVALSTAMGNTNTFQNTGAPPATPYQTVSTAFGSAPAYAYVVQGKIAPTVKSAGASDACIGMLLYEISDTNRFGEQYRFRPEEEKIEQQVVLIGEAAPIVKRGTFLTNNLRNVVGGITTGWSSVAGSGFTASGGYFVPQVYSRGTSLGIFLSNGDADGYVWVALDCV
jgi:hypothetical protein